MSADPFTSHQTEYAPAAVVNIYAHEPIEQLNLMHAVTGNAYPIDADWLRREQVKDLQWAHLRKYYAKGDQ